MRLDDENQQEGSSLLNKEKDKETETHYLTFFSVIVCVHDEHLNTNIHH